MKRPQVPSQDTALPKRNRVLSDEERAVWESVARQVKPLRKKPRVAKPHAVSVTEAPAVKAPAKASAAPSAPRVAKQHTPAVPPLAPLGRRERSQLSRGRKEIEARLDLHGLTQMRAHQALAGFLQRAHSEGLSFVLIITGKGKAGGGDSERGVLRRQVPQWLSLPEFRALVVGFEEAHIGHGGEGALYVRIRRARR